MNTKLMALALLSLAGTSAALAAPQETFDYVALNGGLPLIGTAVLGGGNSIVSATATGAYTVQSITFAGNVGAWGAGTWGSESRIQLTTANGTNIVFGPFSPLNSTPAGPIAFSFNMNVAAQTAAGSWTVETYETYNDVAVDDATYDAVTLELNDAIVVTPPPANTDLGDHSVAASVFSQEVAVAASTDIQWFRIVLPAVNSAAGWVDIWTSASAEGVNMTDTEIGLYNANGDAAAPIFSNDDANGLYSLLSYGSNVARPAIGTSAPRAGQSGVLSGGVYYVAAGRYNVNFSAIAFGAVGTSTGGQTNTVLNFDIAPATAPYAPSATGVVSPASVEPAGTVVFAATVVPGGNPTSTGIVVRGDLTAIGGSATALFHDDGLAGDAAAGDGIYSYSYVIPAATAGGTYSVAVTVTDAQSRTGTTTITGSVFNPEDLGQIGAGAGGTEVVTTHDVTVNAPGEVQWYKFSIGTDILQGSTNYMDIDTEPTADDGTPAVGSINDTELGLFATDGTLLADDDDSGSNYHTQLSFGDNTNFRPAFGNGAAGDGRDGDLATGTYYLAGGLFNVTFAANFVVTGASATGSGVYQINFRTNIPGGGTGNPCGPADIGSTGGVAGADNHLDNNDFIVYIDNFFNHLASADIGATGGVAGTDGAWDNNDFIVFIDQFFNAPASCR